MVISRVEHLFQAGGKSGREGLFQRPFYHERYFSVEQALDTGTLFKPSLKSHFM
jgi:hypothetical protein